MGWLSGLLSRDSQPPRTAGLWERLTHGTRRLLHRPPWSGSETPATAGLDFDQIMEVQVTQDFHAKQGRSTGRWVVRTDAGALAVYLKRHRRLPWHRRLLATLWPTRGWSPALTEWRNLQWAQKHDIPVPEPVAAGEWIGPWFKLESFLVVKELTGMLPLHEALPLAEELLPPASLQTWKRAVVAEMARLCRRLHQARRYHKDLYLCHFFVPRPATSLEAGQQPLREHVHLIDFHRLGRHPWTGWYRRIKDLAQLLYSSDVPGVTERDRLAFLHLYLGQTKLNRAGRWLMRLVCWKAARYRRHNAKSPVVCRPSSVLSFSGQRTTNY